MTNSNHRLLFFTTMRELTIACCFLCVGIVGCFSSINSARNQISISLPFLTYVTIFMVSTNMACIGALLAAQTINTASLRLFVSRNFLVLRYMWMKKTFRWNCLRKIKRSTLAARLPDYFGLGGVYDTATLSFCGGGNISIGPAAAYRGDLLLLAERIFLHSSARQTIDRINRGEVVDFKSFTASFSGLQRHGSHIAWESIHSACASTATSILVCYSKCCYCEVAVEKTDNICLLLFVIRIKSGVFIENLPKKFEQVIEHYAKFI